MATPQQHGKPVPQGLAFLTAPQRAAANEERQRLSQYSGWDASYRASEAIDCSRKHADDPRVPAAPHRAVAATHFGCTDDHSSKYSRQGVCAASSGLSQIAVDGADEVLVLECARAGSPAPLAAW